MSPKILRRCTICQRLGAAYLVEDEQLGKLILCYACWKKRYADKKEESPAENKSSAQVNHEEENGAHPED